jgi:hypothetical protein
MPPNERGLKPLILPQLVNMRAQRGNNGRAPVLPPGHAPPPPPFTPEEMMQRRLRWAVKLECGIEHAESGGWGLSVTDYETVNTILRRQRRLVMPPSVGSSRDGERIRAGLRVPANLPVDWAHLAWYIGEKARQPFNVAQLMQVRTLMNNWQSVLTTVKRSIDEAYEDIKGAVDTQTAQRRASLAVSGRMTWGFLSTMVPPPLGVGLGAIVLWMVDDTHSDGIMKLLEWWLQMPFLFDKNTGQVVAPTYRNRYDPNVQNRFPLAYNPGGQPSMKDTKDFNQMIKGIEKLFSGPKRKKIDKWDKATIKFLIARLKKLEAGKSGSLQDGFEAAIKILTEELQNAFNEVIAEWEEPDSSRRLINALFALKRDEIMAFAQRPDVVTHMMQELISYFFNRLVHDKLIEIRNQARSAPPPITEELRTNTKNWAQMALIASYFMDNLKPAHDPMEATGERTTPQEEMEIATRGGQVVRYALFKSNMIAPVLSNYFGNAMENKLLELEIVSKVERNKLRRRGAPARPVVPAPAPARWLTRGPVVQSDEDDDGIPMDIEAQPWSPDVLPIPYKDIGARITRARMAAWARATVDRHADPARYTNAFLPGGMLRPLPGHDADDE